MTNHVHLIAVPQRADSLARAIGRAHMRYARRANREQGWRGHLWANRFYSTPLDDGHLWQAVKYVELNPVRAGMAERAEDYPWSSARAHCDPSAPAGPWGTTWNSRTGWVGNSGTGSGRQLAPCLSPNSLLAPDPLLSAGRPFPATDLVGDWSAWLAAGVEEETVRRIRYATATGRAGVRLPV